MLAVAEKLVQGKSFVVVGHVSPDGDSLGSILALVGLLRGQGKHAFPVSVDGVPEKYQFLPGSHEVISSISQLPPSVDTVVIVDCGDIDRTGLPEDYVRSRSVVNIDHHRSNDASMGAAWVDEKYAATGEMIFTLAEHMKWAFGKDVATALYTTLATDTGFFRYSNTRPATLRTAALLLEQGIDARQIAEQTVERRTMGELCVLGDALQSLKQYYGGLVNTIAVRRETCDLCGVSPDDVEGMVDYPRSLPGTEVALLLREVDANRIRVSFRSRGKVDVSSVAADLGGGGHSRAAGCTLEMSLVEAEALLVDRLARELGSNV